MMESGGSIMGYCDNSIDKSFTDQEPPSKPCSSNSAPSHDVSSSTTNSCFDCSICLDFAVEPVVTLCGHLYCWACLYKWLQVKPTPFSHHCPVCKSTLSQSTLVPLYGRGDTKKTRNLDIPKRPTIVNDDIAHLVEEEGQHSHRRNNHHDRHHYLYSSSLWGGTGVFSSTAGGVLGGLAIAILPWVTRNRNGGGGMHVSRLYGIDAGGTGLGSIQRRRQEMRVEQLLHQLWVFLFCCAVLCLLLF